MRLLVETGPRGIPRADSMVQTHPKRTFVRAYSSRGCHMKKTRSFERRWRSLSKEMEIRSSSEKYLGNPEYAESLHNILHMGVRYCQQMAKSGPYSVSKESRRRLIVRAAATHIEEREPVTEEPGCVGATVFGACRRSSSELLSPRRGHFHPCCERAALPQRREHPHGLCEPV